MPLADGRWYASNAPIATGNQTINAPRRGRKCLDTATSMRLAVDATPPTASIAYDPDFKASPTAPVTGRVTVTFSEPVRGVSLANVRFTDVGMGFTVGLGSPLLGSYVGVITTTQLSDRSYAFTPSVQSIATGNYVVSFLKTGVSDFVGNPLAANAAARFSIA